MPTLFASNESSVMINGEAVEGVRAIEYRRQQVRTNIYGLGSAERIGMISGPLIVEGLMRVTSTSPALDKLMGDKAFQVTANLKHGSAGMTVTFDECFIKEKSYTMEVGGHGEALYTFTATRVREEAA
jgi:hypothetical protein